MVDKWCSDAWKAQHKEWKDRQDKNLGNKAHHQGNRDLLAYAETVEKRTGVPCSEYAEYNLSHMGKASEVGPYDASTAQSAYTSTTSYRFREEYISKFKEKYGSDSDPSMHDLDPEVVMLAGKGKKHGRFAMGGGGGGGGGSIISTTTTPTLPRIKTRRTSSSSAINPRATPVQLEMEARLAEAERANAEKWEARLAEERRANDEKWEARLAEERRSNDEKMNEMFADFLSKQGLPPLDRQARSPHTPFQSDGASNEPGSSHVGNGNPLGDSPM